LPKSSQNSELLNRVQNPTLLSVVPNGTFSGEKRGNGSSAFLSPG